LLAIIAQRCSQIKFSDIVAKHPSELDGGQSLLLSSVNRIEHLRQFLAVLPRQGTEVLNLLGFWWGCPQVEKSGWAAIELGYSAKLPNRRQGAS
jgi:hypothetical protein